MSDEPRGFVSLKALRTGPPNPLRLLTEIRRIYFTTKKQTIERDLARAVELLRALPSDEDRERARVYMDGLSQMRSDWSKRKSTGKGAQGKRRSKR